MTNKGIMTSPMIVGTFICSTTILGSIVLYLMYKKQKISKDPREIRIKTSRQTTIEIKVPADYVNVIIGRAGNRINEIRKLTQTQIFFQDYQPDENIRICVIRGKPESLIIAESLIRDIISSQPVTDKFNMFIPVSDVGCLIGINGKNIRKIMKASKAKITIDPSVTIMDGIEKRNVIVEGTVEEITKCVTMIENELAEDHEFNVLLQDIAKTSPNEKRINAVEDNGTNEKTNLNESKTQENTLETKV